MISHATKFSLLLVSFFLALVTGLSLNFYMVRYQVEHSQGQWCDTLRLLTSHPVTKPPDARKDPSRYENWQFYEDLLRLKNKFGC